MCGDRNCGNCIVIKQANVGNLICNIAMMYRNVRRPVSRQPRSNLIEQKNILAVPDPEAKINPKKTIVTRACSRRQRSQTDCQPDSQNIIHPSPKVIASQPTQTTTVGFSKSQEETKAEKDEHTEGSPVKEKGWTGLVAEYQTEIKNYVLRREDEYRILGSYLNQSQMPSTKLRVYLIRHMFKVCNRFDLMRTTLHLAVLYLDLYFDKHILINDQLQAVTVSQACLFMAMKYEEIYPPDLRDWVDRKHRPDVLKMQAQILQALNFQLAHYTLQHHLKMQMWQKGQDMDEDESHIALIADLTLFDLKLREQPASELAAAIYSLVRRTEPKDKRICNCVRWMVERNSQSLAWLQSQKYGAHTVLSFV